MYSGAIYLAGVAVECLLRAYMVRKGGEIDTRHDLSLLLERSGMIEYLSALSIREVQSLVGQVGSRWDNLRRFMSDDRLRSEYRRQRLHLGIKGDFLKETSRTVFKAAHRLYIIGEEQWRSKRK
jgi:HEPN domain-containing protein